MNKNIKLLLIIPFASSFLSGCSTPQFLGNGTTNNPYLIVSASDVAKLSGLVFNGVEKYMTAHYKLTNDIDMNNQSILSIGYSVDKQFKGTFDGGGFTISNFDTHISVDMGLFGYVGDKGMIKNLKIDNNIDYKFKATGTNIGGIVGYLSSGASIDNCSFTGSLNSLRKDTKYFNLNANRINSFGLSDMIYITRTDSTMGGIAGVSLGSITNCYVSASLSGSVVGGIAGMNSGNISNCEVTDSTLTTSNVLGSFVGHMDNLTNAQEISIVNSRCSNVSLTSPTIVGGMVGATTGRIKLANLSSYGMIKSIVDWDEYIHDCAFGDVIGCVMYKGIYSENEENDIAEWKDKNIVNFSSCLSCFDYQLTGQERKAIMNFPYYTLGCTPNASNNLSVLRIKTDETKNYEFDKMIISNHNVFLDSNSNIQLDDAKELSLLNKSEAATLLNKKENELKEITVNGLKGYSY